MMSTENTAMQVEKSNVTVVGGEKVHPRVVEVALMLIEQAMTTSKRRPDSIVLNFLEGGLRKGATQLYSTFTAPNLISIDLDRHLKRMNEMAQETYLRGSMVLWYELLLSIGHELHHMLMEYMPFDEHYSNNTEALQIGPTYDCTKAEAWSGKQILALGFEHDINPPEEWATGILDEDMLSEKLSTWQCTLPGIDERWAERQQHMIDNNLSYVDNGVTPSIVLDKFSDWLAVEGNWTISLWETKLKNKPPKTTQVATEAVPDPEQSVSTEPVIDVEPDDERYDVSAEDVPMDTEPDTSAPEFMTNPVVNPTLAEMKSVMYHTFMVIYNHIFSQCGWMKGADGNFFFSNVNGVLNGASIKDIPNAGCVMVNYTGSSRTIVPIWPDGVIAGLVFVNGTVPAVKLGVRTVSGNILTYTVVAQNPMKDSAWGKSARVGGVKSAIIFKDDGGDSSTLVIRILNGQFISNPLGLGGGQATTVTADTLTS